MKKRLLFAIIVLALIVAFSINAAAAAQTVKITFTAVAKGQNDHVGNSWTHAVIVGDKLIKKGSSTTFAAGEDGTISVLCRSTEGDKTPDVGEATLSINANDLVAGKAVKYKVEVVAAENSRRYKGNTATSVYTITVTKSK